MSTGRESSVGSDDSDRAPITSQSATAGNIADQFDRDVDILLTEAAASTVMPTPLSRKSLEDNEIQMRRNEERLSDRETQETQAANDRRVLELFHARGREGRIDQVRGFRRLDEADAFRATTEMALRSEKLLEELDRQEWSNRSAFLPATEPPRFPRWVDNSEIGAQ